MTMRLRIREGTIDLARATLERGDGDLVRLTGREVALLGYLADRAGEDVSRDALLRDVWSQHELSLSRAVDTAVARLRRKIESDPSFPVTLCTAHGDGYRLVLEGRGAAAPPSLEGPPTPRRQIRLGGRTVDLDAGVVRGPHGAEPLTGQERCLLERLLRAGGRAVDPEALARAGRVIGGRGAIANAIHRLRGKLEGDPAEPAHLVTVRGQGYRLDGVEDAASRVSVPTSTLWALAEQAARLLDLEDCVVYVRDGNELVQAAAFGPKAPRPGEILHRIHLPIGRGVVGDAARTGQMQCVPDVRSDPRYVADAWSGRSELAVPIASEGEVVGVLDTESPRLAAYDARERTVLESLARVAAAATEDLRRKLAAA